jgi:hypothetical protein
MSAKPKINIKTILYWLFVFIPLLWGVSKTIEKSMALFN